MSVRLRNVLFAGFAGWLGLAGLLLLDPTPDPLWLLVEDVIGHGVLFAIGGAIGHALLLDRGLIQRLTWTVLGGGTLAVLLEFAQAVATGSTRSAEVADAIAGIVGAAVGFAIVSALSLKLSSRRIGLAVAAAAWLTIATAVAISVAGSSRAVVWYRCLEVRSADSPIALTERGVASSEIVASDELACAIMRANEFTLVVDVSTDDLGQLGPTRLVTISTGTSADDVNMHLGQEASGASVRVRTGRDRLDSVIVGDIFTDGGQHRLVLRYDEGIVTVVKDGILIEQLTLGAGSLEGWRLDYPLIVGDELSGDRLFDGSIERAELYARALSDDELIEP